MSTRAEKSLKAQREKHHAILRELVQETTNKTCADCLAKGPRWASWSLGVFICIRCAGIHRNLGVHISKVKSVDLDSWSTEQIEHILKWGNKRAAEYYECYLPKDFTRPQGNHAVESFIRNKYEKKLYKKKDGEPEPNPTTRLDKLRGTSAPAEKENKAQSQNPSRRRQRPEKKAVEEKPNNTILTMASHSQATETPASAAKLSVANHQVKSSSMNDLLSLDHPGPTTPDVKPSASSNDLLNFGLFSDPVPTQQAPDPFQMNDQSHSALQTQSTNDPFQNSEVKNEAPKSTKESIMSLYSSGNTGQQKMFGVPGGVYMNQQQMPSQQMYAGYPQKTMPNQMTHMNAQMQHMNLNTGPQMHMMQQQKQQQTGFGQQGGYNQLGYNQGFNQPRGNYNQRFNAANQFTQQGYNANMHGNVMNQQAGGFNRPSFQNNMQQSHVGNTMGQSVMGNTAWSANQNMSGGMAQQQQLQANGNVSMNFNMNSGMNSMGHTMNNQLWN